jgi:hypothetical protein
MKNKRWPRLIVVIITLALVAACGGKGGSGGAPGVDQPDPNAVAQTAQAAAGGAGGQPDPNAIAQTAQAQAGGGGQLDPNAIAATAQAVAGGLDSTAMAATAQAAAGEAATSVAATAQAAAATAGVAVQSTVAPTDATTAIISYASTVLGISVNPIYAGGLNAEVQRAVDTSAQTGSTTPSMVDVAVVSYGAVFADGGATLSYGDGAITGDIQVDINTSSLGAYTLVVAGPMPASEVEALNFVLANFPGLGGRAYTARSAQQGYAWQFTGQTQGYNRDTKQAELIAEAVVIGVADSGGRGPRAGDQVLVYAVVGRGSFAAAPGLP